MRLGHNKSSNEPTESTFSENISLVACPFLGLDEDPGTSLGYAHAANQCYRLEKPAGIDLAHQNRYCLCENYTRCYVYGQSRRHPKTEKTPIPTTLPVTDDLQFEETASPPRRQAFRLLGLLLMLLLIGIAAIIWWPPPGRPLQDFVVLGSTITKVVAETDTGLSDGSFPDEKVHANTADLTEQSRESVQLLSENESTDQALPPVVEESGDEAIDQERSNTADLASPEQEGVLAAENLETSEDRVEDQSDFDSPVVYLSEISAVQEKGEANQTAEQGSAQEMAVAQQSEESAEDALGGQEPGDVSTVKSSAPESVSPEQGTSSAPTAVRTTFIGPIPNAAGLQDTDQSSPLLYLLKYPADGADVLAMLPERQSVTVLGRNNSGEWLLVRLASGVEGWVHGRQSGASVVVSTLPILEDISGRTSASSESSNTAEPAEETQNFASQAGESSVFGTALIKTGALNLRSGPGLEYESIAVGYNGQQVSLLEQFASQAWIQIRLPNGKQGWVNSSYLSQTG